MPFPVPTKELKIFDELPTPSEDVFNAGVPIVDTEGEACALILYSPNLQIISSMDNTNSRVTTTYETSVTYGFKFSSTQTFSISEEVGVNIEVVTEKTTVSFALSFTEEWSTSITKSMSFSCPPGEKAFVYQGTLVSRVMSLNSDTAQYEWKAAPGKAMTQVLLTSETPVGAAPSNKVTINQS
ncbi:MAG: hypothetical protein HWE30_02365 [Methylocystaceae bacterium]|nr:hypothetical protein [Methylocystaceae bacterium]